MRIFIHADTDAFTARIGSKDAPSTIRLKAGIAETRVEVVFHRDSAAVSLPEGAAGRICLKELGKYDSSPLAYAEGWTLEGAGTTPVYVFQLNLNGVELLALLNSGDGDPDNDSAWVDLMLEIEWTASGSVHKTQNTPRVRIHHPVLHDYDGTPIPMPTVDEWLDARSIRHDIIQDISAEGKARARENFGIPLTLFEDTLAASEAAEDFATAAGTSATASAGSAAAAAASAASLLTSQIYTYSGTSVTLDASNAGLNSWIRLTSASAVSVSVATGLAAGLTWVIRQAGAGVATVSLSGGTVNGRTKSAGQHTELAVIHLGSNTVDLVGGVS